MARAQQGAREGLRAWALLKGLPPNWQSPFGMRWEDNRLVADPNYHVACDIWRMALEAATQWGIAKHLTQRGVPTSKGGSVWRSSTIKASCPTGPTLGWLRSSKLKRWFQRPAARLPTARAAAGSGLPPNG